EAPCPNDTGTCLAKDPRNLFFCAAVEDGATASSRSLTSKNEASRTNRPGTRMPEDPKLSGSELIAAGQGIVKTP
ncbi:MAG: hypothetical protein ACLQBD_20370, partial [Syntrophobacteraceae bacterium]